MLFIVYQKLQNSGWPKELYVWFQNLHVKNLKKQSKYNEHSFPAYEKRDDELSNEVWLHLTTRVYIYAKLSANVMKIAGDQLSLVVS